MKHIVTDLLKDRGVELDEIAQIVYELQIPYVPALTMEECRESVDRVIEKRETQYAVLTGVALDMAAERGELPEPLGDALRRDESLYGIDEVIALAITNLYGSIGLTSFGYLDKKKPGVIGRLNQHAKGKVHTFLDDLIAGIAAASSARLAHHHEGDAFASSENGQSNPNSDARSGARSDAAGAADPADVANGADNGDRQAAAN